MGVDSVDLYKNITKPKIKVGNEFVAKGMNVDQCNYSIGALAKSLFDRLFKYLVTICNKTLATGQKRATFIGVLDIAGFEIFDVSLSSNRVPYYISHNDSRKYRVPLDKAWMT